MAESQNNDTLHNKTKSDDYFFASTSNPSKAPVSESDDKWVSGSVHSEKSIISKGAESRIRSILVFAALDVLSFFIAIIVPNPMGHSAIGFIAATGVFISTLGLLFAVLGEAMFTPLSPIMLVIALGAALVAGLL